MRISVFRSIICWCPVVKGSIKYGTANGALSFRNPFSVIWTVVIAVLLMKERLALSLPKYNVVRAP